MSKLFSLLAVAVVAFSGSNAGASDNTAVKSAVREMLAKDNAGSDVSAAFDENCKVIDEVGPFSWTRFPDWGSAIEGFYKQNGVTASKTRINGFRHVNIKGGRAYVVIDVTYSSKQNGKIHREPGLEVMTLKHADPGWKIDSFAWFGRNGVDAGADATAINAAIQDFASMKGPPSPELQAITDEFPPFAWSGPSANADWYAALQKLLADGHATSIALAAAAPSELQINGSHAYASVPTVITTTVAGKAKREKGDFAFALQKTAGTWHITSWAWATE